MECKRALEASDGDLERALHYLAERGIATAEKKANRVTAQGLLDCYIHAGRIGAIVEVNCETDFVARTPVFQTLVHDIAMQVAASTPLVVSEVELLGRPEGAETKGIVLSLPILRDFSKTVRQLIN